MSRRIAMSAFINQVLVGLVEDNHLVEFFLERDEESRVVGNIYKGKVANVLPGMSAAFVNIGLDRNAFFYVGDVASDSKGKPIEQLVRKNQEMLVQVTKEPAGTKGARVISQISIPGRYLVLMPQENQIGVSRQITNAKERDRLKQIASEMKPEGMGVIVRTVAADQDENELRRDLKFLLRTWNDVAYKAKRSSAPDLIYKDHDLVYRMIRDALTDDIEEVIVDTPALYKKVEKTAKSMSLEKKAKLTLYQGELPLFDYLGIANDLEKACRKRVWLDSGGYLIIDQTEALISIDVNTGKYVGSKNLADTVLKTNREAAREIAKQLRLRNLGGIIIIDFIDMDSEKAKKSVLVELQKALAEDKTKSHVLGFTHLGLVEMTRKKAKKTLSHMLQTTCPECQGTGKVFSESTIALNTAQKVYAIAQEPGTKRIKIDCHPSVATWLKGANGENIASLQREVGKSVSVRGVPELAVDDVQIQRL